MKFLITILMLVSLRLSAQQPPGNPQEQLLEELAEKENADMEDDQLLQQLEIFKGNPIRINTATADELQQLQMLTAIQIQALIQYRHLLGNLVHIYELQAIPYWDVYTIRRVLPYVTITPPSLAVTRLPVAGATSQLLLRFSQTLGKDTTAEAYLGTPQKLMMRYRYHYKNLLQAGFLCDKDAGEPFFRRKQVYGFDFYSFHLFMRKRGIVQSLALGDFTVNMGQGLIQWQGLSFRKSSEVTTSKRQSAVLRPYTSSGEHNFHRGIGISLHKKRMLFTVFASMRKLSANLGMDTSGNTSISSFLPSGLHRTEAEMLDRNNITQQAIGGSVAYEGSLLHVGLNLVQYGFSHPVNKRDEPYNFFTWRGTRQTGCSIDYDHTWRNVHLFGEAAVTHPGHFAIMQGLLVSLHRKLSMTMVFRHLPPAFQPVYASGFTENTSPSNESGLFMGLSLKGGRGFVLDVYADVFRFPWLKFRTDAPSTGKEYLVQLTWRPHKKLEISSRFRAECKQTNDPQQEGPVNVPVNVPKTNWRAHIAWHVSSCIRLRQRVELVWINKTQGQAEEGFLIYNDVAYDPPGKPYSVSGRLQLFETDGFNSRIYAFENDVPSAYAVPAVHQKGVRYYFNLGYGFKTLPPGRKRFPQHVNIHLRWAQTCYQMQSGIALQPSRPELKIQVVFSKY